MILTFLLTTALAFAGECPKAADPTPELELSGLNVSTPDMQWCVRYNTNGKHVDEILDGKKKIKLATYAFYKDRPFGMWSFWNKNGTIRRRIQWKDGIPNGSSAVYDEGGRPVSLIHYDNGVFHGSFTAWHPNGQKAVIGSFKKGKKDGRWEWSNTKGQPVADISFADGFYDGATGTWYESSDPTQAELVRKELAHYSKGKKNGISKTWFENGQLSTSLEYKDDKPSGSFAQWYRDGQKREEGQYLDGMKSGAWIRYFPNGTKEAELSYNSDKPDGTIKTYHPNGILSLQGEYARGLPVGKWVNWYKSSRIQRERTFDDFGRQTGKETMWFENGKKEKESNYARNVLHGNVIRWNVQGEIIEKTVFKDGQRQKDPKSE